jgi:hypothetical protein
MDGPDRTTQWAVRVEAATKKKRIDAWGEQPNWKKM